MRTHTIDFKNEIKNFGKELDEILTYYINDEIHILPSENIKSIRYSINTDLLKSSMRMLNIECENQIPKDTVINFKHGVKVKNSFDYINYGDFVVYESPKNEDSNTYSIVCYDKMLYSMTDYEELDITYPISVRDYITKICNKIGLEFQNKDDVFTNYNKTIKKDLYKGLGYTYRDILDELAQVTASNICINVEGQLEIRYIEETNDTIDEEYLKDTNVQFGQKYGPVNCVVLSRSADSDNICLPDDESIAKNGLCEIKIKDNQIMNWNDRNEYLVEIFDKLNGLSYYENDFSSSGICYYDIYDKYNVKIGNSIYPCLLLNDELVISNDNGQSEDIYTELPEITITDYTKSDKVERSNTNLNLIVNQQGKRIDALNEQIINTTTSVSSVGLLQIDSVLNLPAYELKIQNACQLFPSKKLYPNTNLYSLGRWLRVAYQDGTYKRYKLPILSLRELDGIYDELWIKTGKVSIIKRIGMNKDESLYLLDEPIITEYDDINLEIKQGINEIQLESFSNALLNIEYMIDNIYTQTFSTKVETKAALEITTNKIGIEVSKKLDSNEYTGAKIIARINSDGSESIISADKISLEGKDIDLTSNNISITSDNFTVTKEGKVKAVDGEFSGNIYFTGSNSKIVGSDGLLTNLQYKSTGKYGSYAPLGFEYLWINGDQNFRYYDLSLDVYIPDEFTIIEAYITLFHTPIDWYVPDNEHNTYEEHWGYVRNIKLYKSPNTVNYTYMLGNYTEYELILPTNNLNEIIGAFGQNGYTATNVTGNSIQSKKSINIKEFLSVGNNKLVLRTTYSNPLTESEAAERTGMCYAVLNIIGYMKIGQDLEEEVI